MKKRLPETILYWSVAGLLAYMPFHIFLSRWLSLYTGGLGPWDAAKDIITSLAAGLALLLCISRKLYRDRRVLALFLLAGAYFLLHLAYFAFNHRNLYARSFILGTLYNGRIIAYLLIALVAARIYPKIELQKIIKITLVVSTITCLIALAQYVLPKDLMTHFGYSIERGVKPNFFIDDKPDFPRVMSTIRDPNSYGAYLIIPITLLWAHITRLKKFRVKALGLLAVHLLALLLTFSRGAWLGACLSLAVVTFLLYKKELFATLQARKWLILALCIAAIPVVLVLKNQYVFQNVFLHSDKSTVLKDPNELRIEVQRNAVTQIARHPEGHGPGTAGLTSIGNPKGTVLMENYFLQIAYEVGVQGLLIFLSLLALAYYLLVKAPRNYMSASLLASFWAYVFIATLIHLWSNEAVAAQWWLLAGLAAGLSADLTPKPRHKSA